MRSNFAHIKIITWCERESSLPSNQEFCNSTGWYFLIFSMEKFMIQIILPCCNYQIIEKNQDINRDDI